MRLAALLLACLAVLGMAGATPVEVAFDGQLRALNGDTLWPIFGCWELTRWRRENLRAGWPLLGLRKGRADFLDERMRGDQTRITLMPSASYWRRSRRSRSAAAISAKPCCCRRSRGAFAAPVFGRHATTQHTGGHGKQERASFPANGPNPPGGGAARGSPANDESPGLVRALRT